MALCLVGPCLKYTALALVAVVATRLWCQTKRTAAVAAAVAGGFVFAAKAAFGWSSADFGPDGHIGDPTGASAEHGKMIFEGAVGRLAEVIVEAHRFTTQ